MIKIYNENRLTRQPFFNQLIDYLASAQQEMRKVTLREIHHQFSEVKNLDRQIEQFIVSGFILRKEKHYYNAFHIFDDSDFERDVCVEEKPKILQFSDPFFVHAESQICQLLEHSFCHQVLTNHTNTVQIHTSSHYDLTTATLANYFYKVALDLPLSAIEQKVYAIMGDVDPEYSLKYMTTFLLKFLDRNVVTSRADIFVRVLEIYGFVKSLGNQKYEATIEFDDSVKIPVLQFDHAQEFIAAQIRQTQEIKNFISLGE